MLLRSHNREVQRYSSMCSSTRLYLEVLYKIHNTVAFPQRKNSQFTHLIGGQQNSCARLMPWKRKKYYPNRKSKISPWITHTIVLSL